MIYLPIDKTGADLLFQIISQRYERGSIAITTNRVYKHWPEIFNQDATLTSAVLDRLLHHAETVTLEGKSFRMKDVIAVDPSGLLRHLHAGRSTARPAQYMQYILWHYIGLIDDTSISYMRKLAKLSRITTQSRLLMVKMG